MHIKFSVAITVLSLLIISFTYQGHAQEKALDKVISSCHYTPQFTEILYDPGQDNVVHTNNLRRKTGLAWIAKGERIYISGKVVDQECIPVSDAVITLWHADSFGKYHHPDDTSDKEMDEHFTGSGQVLTDNLGNFRFITIFPGSIDEVTAPTAHIKVTHPEFETFYTRMYFPEQLLNSDDVALQNFSGGEQTQLISRIVHQTTNGTYQKDTKYEDDETYIFNITLPGKNTFRRY